MEWSNLMSYRVTGMFIVALLAGTLAACGGAPATETTSAPTAAATAVAAAPAPATAAAAAPAPATGMRTFMIIPEQSEASYAVQETFLSQNLPNKAVGKTNAITGTFQFSMDGKPTGQVTNITVDLRTLKSDSDRRDNIIRTRWLESNTYPYAEFTSTDVQGAPESYTEGQEVSFKLLGNMTIHNTTKPVTFDVTGKLEGDTVTGTATTRLNMVDFGFEPPNIAGVVSVQDGVDLTINFTAKEQK
jgi:polyisoprenoid-binding protein YceI